MAAPMAGSLGRPLGCDRAAWALTEIAAENWPEIATE
jgi:hypothetical protein